MKSVLACSVFTATLCLLPGCSNESATSTGTGGTAGNIAATGGTPGSGGEAIASGGTPGTGSASASTGGAAGMTGEAGSGGGAPKSKMTFFISSSNPGNGANFGGIELADAHCQQLAAAVGGGDHTWHAYLAVTGPPAINARDRIGTGPWFNQKGLQVAANVDDLHSENNLLNKENALTETGMIVNGRGDTPNRHDILTGATSEGNAYPQGQDHTCGDWTSTGSGAARVGHHDRQGGGEEPTSWNSAHDSNGCTLANLRSTGGDGLIYCFAID
jgi:hypothetical protein